MARLPRVLKVLVPLGAIGGAAAMGRSILRQRSHPEPFPAARAAFLETGFDRALLVAVLGEIPPDRRVGALREIRDALKPDGILYVFEGIGDPHHQSPRAVSRLGADAGFTPVSRRRLGLAHLHALRPEAAFRR
jgi:SAM-dependent methyltransferase